MIIRGAFSDFYMGTMLPALHGVVNNKHKRYPVQFTQIFQAIKSTKSIEQTGEVSGVGQFVSIGEGQAVTFDTPVQGFDKTFIPGWFGLGVQASRRAIEDDKIQLIFKAHADLVVSATDTQEIDAASTINNGTSGSFLGPDGKALFATDHPLYKSGGTQSNLGTAMDLDVTSLQLAMTDFETQKDASGKLIHLAYSKLVVAPSNRWVAYELTKSGMRPDTSNNTVNSLQYGEDGMPTPFVWRYLTDPDGWGLFAAPENTGLIWFWRKKLYPATWTENATETGNYALRYGKSHGWSTFYGTYWNPGA